MKFILQEAKYNLDLCEKYILLEKNNRKEERSLEDGKKLILELLDKAIRNELQLRNIGEYKILNLEKIGFPKLTDSHVQSTKELKGLLDNNIDGWLLATNDGLKRWAEAIASELNEQNKKDGSVFFIDKDEKIISLFKPLPIKDWGEKYRSSTNKNAFWDLYYNNVWGENKDLKYGFDIEEKVRSLGEAFRQELVAFGFKRELNPMISFVEQNLNILNKSNYTAIHDGLARYYLNKNDIKSKGVLGNNNIIFNEDLYKKSYDKIMEYLKIQKEIIDLPLDKLESTNSTGENILNKANKDRRMLNCLLMFKNFGNKPNFKLGILDTHENIKIKLNDIGAESINIWKPNSKAVEVLPQLNRIVTNEVDAKIAIIALTNKFANKSTKAKILNLFEEPSFLSKNNITALLLDDINAKKFVEISDQLSDIQNMDVSNLLTTIQNIGSKGNLKLKVTDKRKDNK